ncbi:MAG: PQQ-binding-like beta-propeller repeat protein [Candidatus Xenobiia bacterium LiM19]
MEHKVPHRRCQKQQCAPPGGQDALLRRCRHRNSERTENKSESPSIISIGADDTLYTSQKLYSSNGHTVVEALDPSTGKTKWSVDLGEDNGFTHAALTPDGTLLVSGEHCIWGIDTKDGKVKSAIGFKPEGYITDLKLNREGTGFFIDDMNNGLQFFSLKDLVDLREEEEKIKREIIEEASESTAERSSGRVEITEDEEFVEIDGMFLRRNLWRQPRGATPCQTELITAVKTAVIII